MDSWSPTEDDNNNKRLVEETDWRRFRARLVAGDGASIPDKWVHPIYEPEKGCLLIATERLDGVHIFERTVILILSIGPMGPSGIILNRPSLMSIKEMKSKILDVSDTFSDQPLFFGGPLEEGLFLMRSSEEETSGMLKEVMKGLCYGRKESIGYAAELVKGNSIGLGDFRFFDGYCGWERGQLNQEIIAGYWKVAACSPSIIGLSGGSGHGLWNEILGMMGPKKVW